MNHARQFADVHYDVRDHVATITLDRPGRRNAMTPSMALQIVDALDLADADDDIRAVIVTGSGEHFCAGADLDEPFVSASHESDPALSNYVDRVGRIEGVPRDGGGVLALRIAASSTPVIAAIRGSAVGIGVTMTLPMDIRIASKDSKFGFVFTRRGLVPEAASSWFLPRVVGMTKACDWVMTGRVFDAVEARDAGLLTHVVDDEHVMGRAWEVAREIVLNTSPVAVTVSRRMLWGMLSAASPWEAHALDSQAVYHLAAQGDVAEGVASFIEKRRPNFPLVVSDDDPTYIPSWPTRPVHL
jgi:enoyl-CoA hydratase/carnithine racemase